MADRDGFVVTAIESGEEIDFISCGYSDSTRDRVLAGLLRNMDTDRFLVGDTRWASSSD